MPSLFSSLLRVFGAPSSTAKTRKDDSFSLQTAMRERGEEEPVEGTQEEEAPSTTKQRSRREKKSRVSGTQGALDIASSKRVVLVLDGMHYHSGGVFSNVYRGWVTSPDRAEVAIKKTWPRLGHRNEELLFLAAMRRNDPRNIIQLLYTFKNVTSGSTCEGFVFSFMPETLDQVIKRGALDATDTKMYTWQLFNGLHFLALNRIVHRDIKPVNILVNDETGELQIGDFGSAKVINSGESSSAYQVTRYYRPPEILLGSTTYTWRVDLWSAGCVFGEMMRGRVFLCGRDASDQLRLVQEAIGSPTEIDLLDMHLPSNGPSLHHGVDRRGLSRLLPRDTPRAAIEFLRIILQYSPKTRLHGNRLLDDPFFDDILSPDCTRRNGQPTQPLLIKSSSISIPLTLLLRQHGPSSRPYPFKEVIAKNRGKNTPVIPSPLTHSATSSTATTTDDRFLIEARL